MGSQTALRVVTKLKKPGLATPCIGLTRIKAMMSFASNWLRSFLRQRRSTEVLRNWSRQSKQRLLKMTHSLRSMWTTTMWSIMLVYLPNLDLKITLRQRWWVFTWQDASRTSVVLLVCWRELGCCLLQGIETELGPSETLLPFFMHYKLTTWIIIILYNIIIAKACYFCVYAYNNK